MGINLEVAEAFDRQGLFLCPSALDVVDLLLHLFCRDGLHQIARHPQLDCRHRILLISGTEHDLTVRTNLHDFFRKGQSAHPAHIDIQKCNVCRIAPYPIQRVVTGRKLRHGGNIRGCLYRLHQRIEHQGFIIYRNRNHCSTFFGMDIHTFVPTPGVLSTVSVPPHITSTRPRIFRRPTWALSSSTAAASKPTPLSSTQTQYSASSS